MFIYLCSSVMSEPGTWITHRSQTSPALVYRAHDLKNLARTQVSGLNLLKYNAGKHGAPLYHRYLRGMYQIIHKNGGGLAYYGKVRCTLHRLLEAVLMQA